MKKTSVLLLGIALTFALTACGGKENNGGTNESTPSQTESTADTTPESTPESTGTDQTGAEEDTTVGDSSIEELKAAVVEALGENYWPNFAADAEMFTQMTGITEDMYEEFLAETPMISMNVDTMIIVKAKEGQVEAVEEAINAYRDAKVNDTMQYPMNVGKTQASMIETIGNYVCFVQLGADVSAAMDESEEAVITQCQEANQAALDAIRNVLNQ